MRRLTPFLALALGAGLLAAAAAGGGSDITITAQPTVLAAPISPQYAPLQLSGSVPTREANQDVTIQANECTFPGWRDALGAHTDSGGSWHLTAGALTKTSYRVRWNGRFSRVVTVQTRPGVRLEIAGRNRWTVSVLAQRSFLDKRGQLQRFDRRTSRWRTVKRYRLTGKFRVGAGSWTHGTFSYRAPRGAQLRAYIPRTQVKPCYLAGFSMLYRVR